MNTTTSEPFDLNTHRLPRPDEGGRVAFRFRPTEYGIVATPLHASLARMVTVGVPHGISAWEARREADVLARPLPDLPAWDERAHLAQLATSIAPGPPLNTRRRRTPLWKRITDWLMAGLP